MIRQLTYALALGCLVVVILYVGRTLWIPLSFALLISFVVYPFCTYLERYLSRALAIAICLVILLLFGSFVLSILAGSVQMLYSQIDALQGRLQDGLAWIEHYLSEAWRIDTAQQQSLYQEILMKALNEVPTLLKKTLVFSANSLTLLLLIPLFVALILYYRNLLVASAIALLPDSQHEKFRNILHQTVKTYYQFIKGMAIVYATVGALNTIGFWALSLPNALFLGVLASLLTFLPYVGIMIGGGLAVAVAFTVHDSLWYPAGVVAILGVVQYLEANLIFPWAVSHQLKINTFVTFLSIIVGGLIWGGAGMILFLPFAAILKLIADRVEVLKPLAIFLGTEEK